MAAAPAFPSPGCVVEYMEDNAVQIAMVLEEGGGKLRLLLPGRKELKLAANRLLPWIGPCCSASQGKEDAVRVLEHCKAAREAQAAAVPVLELWEMAAGEIDQAPASWFAELMGSDPDADTVAAYGRALIGCKTHFRFSPPQFQVFDRETVERRLEEQRAREEREALASRGATFLRLLWEVAGRRRALPPPDADVYPAEPLARRLKTMLMARVADPETQEDESLWRLVGKGLPDVPHVPLQLLMAWGVLPPHYNFWLDRADYAVGDSWWHEYAADVDKLAQVGELPQMNLPLISIDGPSTRDIDDAFCIERTEEGWKLTLAFACPALHWPFGGGLDKLVSHRATSIYLPEGDLHMLPEVLGADACSLWAGKPRNALCVEIDIAEDGTPTACRPGLSIVTLAANLRFQDVQKVINGLSADGEADDFAGQIREGHALALKREALRVENGAVVMMREEPKIYLKGEGEGVEVRIEPEPDVADAMRLVSEMMILASACIADWAAERNIPLLHRTQCVALPKEYAGVWSKPEDLTRIMRSLIPSSLEIPPRPHAALGLARYAQVTSPLRRYPDLINEAQVVAHIQTGAPRFDVDDLERMLQVLSPALDAAGQAQRNRPRYWKLMYIRQMGDKHWWDGVITEENDMFVNVSMPGEGLFVRGRRQMFDERAAPGMAVRLRLGKVNPLANEIQILEVMSQ